MIVLKDKIKHKVFNCDFCGKEQTQKLTNYNRYKNHFCSLSCNQRYRWKDTNVIKEQKLKEEVYCACGCGVKLKKYTLVQKEGGIRERRFINGHHNIIPNEGQFKKGKASWNTNLTVDTDKRLGYNRPTTFQKGNTMTEENKVKMSCTRRNIKIEDFKGFVIDNDPRKNTEESEKHKEWRVAVFERDNYTCQLCGKSPDDRTKHVLNAHHVKPWKDYPELRRDLDNGKTLCLKCHYYVHSKKYNNELNNVVWQQENIK